MPDGFDMVLECDVGIHSETLFRSLRASLNEGGRLVVVDDLVQGGRPPPLGWLRGAFLKSLEDPEARIKTADRVKEYLAAAGYRLLRERTLQNEERAAPRSACVTRGEDRPSFRVRTSRAPAQGVTSGALVPAL